MTESAINVSREATPEVSVVVPTRDRASRLALLLDALEGQTLPRERFEVVVVDDGSRDGTPALLHSRRVEKRLRRRGRGGPAAAREAGWRAASAPLIAFTDDDCRPEPGWLEAALAAQSLAPGALVQGRTRPDPADEHVLTLPRAHSIRVDSLGPFFETCNVLYPRELLERVGGFDQRIPTAGAEDTDLALRALGAGARAVFARDAVVNHAVTQPGVLEAIRGSVRWRTQVELVKRHPQMRAAYPWRGRFWRETHARLTLMVAGLALTRVDPAFALWCVPYLSYRHGWSASGLARSLRQLPGNLAVDGAELAVLAVASARYRCLLL